MNLPDQRILKFLKEHHVLTLATCADNRPWCASCYYVFMDVEQGFVITSEMDSRHIHEALANTYVSGTVVVESDLPGKTLGVQFEGKLRILDYSLANKAKTLYLKKFPLTSLLQNTFWYIEILSIKYTDNRLQPRNVLFWKKY